MVILKEQKKKMHVRVISTFFLFGRDGVIERGRFLRGFASSILHYYITRREPRSIVLVSRFCGP